MFKQNRKEEEDHINIITRRQKMTDFDKSSNQI